jgi:hypothetical protein
MALAWNTRQLIAMSSKGAAGSVTPVEFHFHSRRELFDCTILTADRHHSSAGEWAMLGDHHWYTLAVISRPVYTIPQELCLSFDCFDRTEKFASGISAGPPIDDVALEFGTLLTVFVREPLLPLGARRIGGKPVKLGDYTHVSRTPPSNPIPPAGISSIEMRSILLGLSNTEENHAAAILGAARLYHAALSLSAYDTSTAYFLLVSAIECLSGHHLKDKTFNFDDVEKFKSVGAALKQISLSISDGSLIENVKRELLRAEFFVWQKFRDFVEEFLPDEFWEQKDELRPGLDALTATITKATLRRFLRETYSARSAFTHTGTPFPAHVEIGISERVSTKAMFEGMDLVNKSRFVPAFVWFERLTHFLLREYLFRIIAPELAEKRAKQMEEKRRLLEIIKGLPPSAQESLECLTKWTAKFVGYAVVGPMAPNSEWAVDEASIQSLASAGLIEGASQSLEGTSWIKNREIGNAIGEFFYGADHNLLRDSTILPPKSD